MSHRSADSQLEFKAFISYSHRASSRFAPSFHRSLERFARPWHKARQFRIFRDTTNLSVSPHAWPEIEAALKNSEFFVLLASPAAAESKWVKRETSFWLSNKPAENLLIALVDGEIRWDDEAGDFDWEQTTALPPSLARQFSAEPLYMDFRSFEKNPGAIQNDLYMDRIASVSARLRGVSKDEIYGEHLSQQRRTTRIATAAIALISVLLILAVIGFFVARDQAERSYQASIQTTKLAAADALANDDIVKAVYWYARAFALARDSDPVKAAANRQVAVWARALGTPIRTGGEIAEAELSPDGKLVAFGGIEGAIEVWEVDSAEQRGARLIHSAEKPGVDEFQQGEWSDPVDMLKFGGSRFLAAASAYRRITLWDLESMTHIGDKPLAEATNGVPGCALGADSDAFVSGAHALDSFRYWQVDGKAVLEYPLAIEPEARLYELGDIAVSPDGSKCAFVGYETMAITSWPPRIGTDDRAETDVLAKLSFGERGLGRLEDLLALRLRAGGRDARRIGASRIRPGRKIPEDLHD